MSHCRGWRDQLRGWQAGASRFPAALDPAGSLGDGGLCPGRNSRARGTGRGGHPGRHGRLLHARGQDRQSGGHGHGLQRQYRAPGLRSPDPHRRRQRHPPLAAREMDAERRSQDLDALPEEGDQMVERRRVHFRSCRLEPLALVRREDRILDHRPVQLLPDGFLRHRQEGLRRQGGDGHQALVRHAPSRRSTITRSG